MAARVSAVVRAARSVIGSSACAWAGVITSRISRIRRSSVVCRRGMGLQGLGKWYNFNRIAPDGAT